MVKKYRDSQGRRRVATRTHFMVGFFYVSTTLFQGSLGYQIGNFNRATIDWKNPAPLTMPENYFLAP